MYNISRTVLHRTLTETRKKLEPIILGRKWIKLFDIRVKGSVFLDPLKIFWFLKKLIILTLTLRSSNNYLKIYAWTESKIFIEHCLFFICVKW